MRMMMNMNMKWWVKFQSKAVKVAFTLLLMGFAFILLSSSSSSSSNSSTAINLELQTPLPYNKPHVPTPQSQTPNAVNFSQPAISGGKEEKEVCDLFSGEWVPNPSGPLYSNEGCPFIESHQNCQKNGRPDSQYLYWRWHPRFCDLPPFDADKFLNFMTNKRFALIGDSISRNHVQSLLCTLNTVDQAVEVYHDEEYKSKTWHFPLHNFTLSVIWSPFLVKADIFEDNDGVSTHEIELHLDTIDKKWKELYREYDYIIFSTGKWFLKTAIYHENNTVLGCHYCPGRNLTELGFDFAYRRTLEVVLDFIASSNHRGLIFFRMSTPDHFENGEWHNGGNCPQTTPVKEGEIKLKEAHQILHDIEIAEYEKAATKAAANGVNLKLLDLTNISLTRPDGHPGPYRQFQPFAKDKNAKVQNDCLHWCLPGPIDAWNDVIMQMVMNS